MILREHGRSPTGGDLPHTTGLLLAHGSAVMLMRFDPFRELDCMRQDRWAAGRMPAMPIDAYRQGDRFFIHFDLPGVDHASIDRTVNKTS